jgi:cytochrome c2
VADQTVMPIARISPLLTALLLAWPYASPAQDAVTANQTLISDAQRRWITSPHGEMLARILPPSKDAASLPEPQSRGASLTVRYCVQCHHLPNPAMHPAEKWPGVVERMVARMKGRGNMGRLMKDMMADVTAPSDEEVRAISDYLRRNAEKPIDPKRYPDLATRGQAFREACSQCHALPDPKSHRAGEWPRIVARMERNMRWMNRVVASKPDPGELQFRVEEIVGYLESHAPK